MIRSSLHTRLSVVTGTNIHQSRSIAQFASPYATATFAPHTSSSNASIFSSPSPLIHHVGGASLSSASLSRSFTSSTSSNSQANSPTTANETSPTSSSSSTSSFSSDPPTPSSSNPLNLPVGKVVSTYTPPPYAPPPSRAELDARRLTFFQTVRQLGREYHESAIYKLSHPIETVRNLFAAENFQFSRTHSLAWKHHYQRFVSGLGLSLPAVAPRRQVLDFSPEKTKLDKFVVLNDNPFGGSSTSRIEMREYEEIQEDGTKRVYHTIVFSGELKNMASFQTSGSRWSDDKGRPAEGSIAATPLKSTPPPAPIATPSTLLSKPPTPSQAAAATNATTTTTSPMSMSSTPPTRQGLASSLSSVTSPSPASVNPSSTPSAPTTPASEPLPISPIPPPNVTPRHQARHNLIHGFAAFISPLYEYPDLDLEHYDYLYMNVRTDGRPYIFNIRCREGVTSSHGNVYQARLRGETPRPMHKMEVRFENFICTQSGRMRSWGTTMPKDRIESFGFSVTGPPGSFELELEFIGASTGVPEFEQRLKAKQLAIEIEDEKTRLQKRLRTIEKRQQVARELELLRQQRGQGVSGAQSSSSSPASASPRSTAPIFTPTADSAEANDDVMDSLRERLAPDAPKTTRQTLADLAAYPAEVQEEMRKELEERNKKLAQQIEDEERIATEKAKQNENQSATSGKLTDQQLRDILAGRDATKKK